MEAFPTNFAGPRRGTAGRVSFFGVYRGIWRYTSIDDLMSFAKAVAAGSIVSMLIILFKLRFRVSRAPFF